ncbi:DUF1499 domain-containing protein [Cerasicoccus fimbriatus]|uniref:DUF1499 domain-containing protein n=1 Tax=Cerasicoccus fimbriatus TaxID=3014554 RepID=UPI0022B48FAE|nr:DUF1499 domain-containing protein [Cerasicoccus sp. TK19100]
MPYVDPSPSGKKRKRRKSANSSGSSRNSKSGSSPKRSRKAKSATFKDKPVPTFSIASSLFNRVEPGAKARKLRAREKVALYVLGFVCLVTITLVTFAWNSRSQPLLDWQTVEALPTLEDHVLGVSSGAEKDSAAYIEPFICRGDTRFALDNLEALLRADDNFRSVRRTRNQLQAVYVSTALGFNNDLVFQARSKPERLEVYASARISIGDFGTNRVALEDLRERLRELHVLR